ncbi:MAG: tripartite tricarboxylate transporter substrate binding protein [Proteobacteria bacterium]|nr:tripartite tricarboxylate transporter substrate binding protein [Burkholderiales bacterium]
MTRRNILHSLLALPGLLLACAVGAQTYPAKPIRIVVAFAPGGPNDILARIVGQKLIEQWGQNVIIENRGGAGGTIGMELASKAPADGYTLSMGSSSNLAAAPSLYPKLGYDPLRDFAPVSNVAFAPYVVTVNPGVPVKNMKELIALARSKKGLLSYGSSGSGSVSSLMTEILKSATGTDIVQVPYKGTAPAVTDVIAGQIDMMIADYAVVAPHAKNGKLRMLAVAGAKRSTVAPELPTVAESGVKGYAVDAWFGLVTPAGVPREIIDKLNSGVVAGLKSADVKQRFETLGYEAVGDTPEQFGATIKADIAKFAKVIKSAGIKAE